MAYIIPDGVIEFFADFGVDSNYENTLYFASTSAKDSYFSGMTKIATVSAQSYTRAEHGYVKVQLPISTLYNVGYMRFRNVSFENKWFYAFVKSVEYINNVTTLVRFELDVMTTWMGAFSLNQCFIERQHTLSDAIGANIAEEGFTLGNYVCEGSSSYGGGDYCIMLYKTYNADKDQITPTGTLIEGTYIPILTFAYPLDSTNLGLLQAKLDDLTSDNRIDEVLSIKLVPMNWVTNSATITPYNMTVAKPYTYIGGSTYQPRNKKLFTYPYKYLAVENCEGKSAKYMYEYFGTLPDTQSGGNCTFNIYGTTGTPEPAAMCTPTSYIGKQYGWDESVSMSSFPSICWNVDAYKAYLAQRDSTLFGNQVSTILTSAARGAAVGAMGGVQGAIGGAIMGATQGTISASKTLLSDTLNELKGNSIPERMPNETRGNAESNIMVQIRQKAFYFRQMSITKNYAMMIDSFFDLYGYAIRQVGTPNMNARPNWTFVKTRGCSVEGNLPADDASRIEDIFDNGVRFWKNHSNIGNYSLSNAPT